MNALVPATRALPGKAPAGQPDKLAITTATLDRSRRLLEQPFRDLDALFQTDAVGCWRERRPIPDLPYPGQPTARAEAWLATLPDDLDEMRDRIAAATEAEADRKETGACVGTLLAAYPSHKEARPEYFATMVHDLTDEGFGPHVVAEACRSIRRSSTFAPSVGEMFAACEKARGRLRTGLRYVERAQEAKAAIETCRAAFDVPRERWPAEWWGAALSHFRGWYPSGSAGSWDDRLGPQPGQEGCVVPPDLLRQWGYDRMAA